MRDIRYITGTRADFGLMRQSLAAIAAHDDLSLSLIATGMHLDSRHGKTIDEIRAAGFAIDSEVHVPLMPATGATMSRNLGTMLSAFTDALAERRPDLVLLLGDRGEMLAGALAAIHLNIPVAHVHGGERSGTVDESVRHAISKLSHIHFTATDGARERLIRMGEVAANVYVTGAPGLDGIMSARRQDRETIMRGFGLDADRPLALVVFHPVLQDADHAGAETEELLQALDATSCAALILMPNSDAGSDAVRAVYAGVRQGALRHIVTHLERNIFIEAVATADVMVGNSSAGIIEAASFGTPVVNIGSRQNLRERNGNVMDVPVERCAIAAAIDAALDKGRLPSENVYGKGDAGKRVAHLLATLPLDPVLLDKVNQY